MTLLVVNGAGQLCDAEEDDLLPPHHHIIFVVVGNCLHLYSLNKVLTFVGPSFVFGGALIFRRLADRLSWRKKNEVITLPYSPSSES